MSKERGRPDATETGAEKPSIFEQFLPQQHKKTVEHPNENSPRPDSHESLDFRQFLPGSHPETAPDAETQSVVIAPPGVKAPASGSEGIIAPAHEVSRRSGLDILDEAAMTEPLKGEEAIYGLQERMVDVMGATGAEEQADE